MSSSPSVLLVGPSVVSSPCPRVSDSFLNGTVLPYFLCCRYVHDDSETTEDKVGLEVLDGLNSADVVLHIQVSRDITVTSS